MSATTSAANDPYHDPRPPANVTGNTGYPNWKIGMWLFIASEVMFFTGLIGSYIVLRLGWGNWPDPESILAITPLAINTFVLIVSSVTMVLALNAIQHDKQGLCMLYLACTALLGCTFLAIKLWDYNHMWHFHGEPYPDGFRIYTDMFGTVYYTLTAFHGLHVLGGIIAFVCLIIGLMRGLYGAKYYAMIENVGLYWHFVDLIWIILFAILCLV